MIRDNQYTILESTQDIKVHSNKKFYRTLMYDKKGNCVYTSLNDIDTDEILTELGDKNEVRIKYIVKCSCPYKNKYLITTDLRKHFLAARYIMDIFNVKEFKKDTSFLLKDIVNNKIISVNVEVI